MLRLLSVLLLVKYSVLMMINTCADGLHIDGDSCVANSAHCDVYDEDSLKCSICHMPFVRTDDAYCLLEENESIKCPLLIAFIIVIIASISYSCYLFITGRFYQDGIASIKRWKRQRAEKKEEIKRSQKSKATNKIKKR